MENHGYSQVLGSASAPYETALAARCGTATHYNSVASPSLPNYLAATSGNTWGIADDGGPSGHALPVNNLFRQVRVAGGTARSYEEGMPYPCALAPHGSYAVKHNPAAYYTGPTDRQACQSDDLPLGTASAGALAGDLASSALPEFAFVTPNLCNDTHDCPVAVGDAWLAQWIPKILSSPPYQAGTTAIFVVWDEDSPMPNIAISPSTPPGTRPGQAFNHYSLLRTTEELLGLPLIGAATTAATMRPAMHL